MLRTLSALFALGRSPIHIGAQNVPQCEMIEKGRLADRCVPLKEDKKYQVWLPGLPGCLELLGLAELLLDAVIAAG